MKISRKGLEGKLKLLKTSVNLISAPYMENCQQNEEGKSIIYLSLKK